MQNTPFDNQIGVRQGRIAPGLATAPDGSFVWTLGMDLASRAEILEFGDHIQIEQTIDVTDITYLRAQLWIKQPKNLDERNVITGLEIVPLSASTISGVATGTPPDTPVRVTTVEDHRLVTGERVTIAGVVGTINVNGTFIITTVDGSPDRFDQNSTSASHAISQIWSPLPSASPVGTNTGCAGSTEAPVSTRPGSGSAPAPPGSAAPSAAPA